MVGPFNRSKPHQWVNPTVHIQNSDFLLSVFRIFFVIFDSRRLHGVSFAAMTMYFGYNFSLYRPLSFYYKFCFHWSNTFRIDFEKCRAKIHSISLLHKYDKLKIIRNHVYVNFITRAQYTITRVIFALFKM